MLTIRDLMDLQLRIRVGSLGSVERQGEEVGAHGVVEGAAAPLAAVVDDLVDDVPVVAAAGEVTGHVGDVCLDDLGELFRGPCTAGNC